MPYYHQRLVNSHAFSEYLVLGIEVRRVIMLKPGHRYWKEDELVEVIFDNDNNPKYRYVLECIWKPNIKIVTFVMLNPSVADYEICDPTLNRYVDFAQRWWEGGMTILNLFAYITPNPYELLVVNDLVGEKNDEIIDFIISVSDEIVFAWGADYGHFFGRDRFIIHKLKEYQLKCIMKSKKGHPRYLLYLRKGLELIAC